MADACEALGHAGRRRQRELLQRELRAGRSTRRRWSACWASSTTSSIHIDGAFKDEGDVVVLLGPPEALRRRLRVPEACTTARSRAACPTSTSRSRCGCSAAVREGIARAPAQERPRLRRGRARRRPRRVGDRQRRPGRRAVDRPGRGEAGARRPLARRRVAIGAVERPDLALFGEGPSRIVVTVAPDDLETRARARRRPAVHRPRRGDGREPAVYHGGRGAPRPAGERAPRRLRVAARASCLTSAHPTMSPFRRSVIPTAPAPRRRPCRP